MYNIRVAEYHTYFVGDEHWGWAAWAHNDYEAFKQEIIQVTKNNLRGVSLATLRTWYDEYAVEYTMTQAELIRKPDRSLGIRGREKITKIINAATTDATGKSFAQRVQAAADAAVAAQVVALQQLLESIGVTDAQIGYRGSVARGTKSAEKTDGTAGYPMDWADVDLDLFIVSDQLASLAGNGKFANRYEPIKQAIEAIELAIRSAINNTPNLFPPGKAINPDSAFRIYTQTEFTTNRLKPSYFDEGGKLIQQRSLARIITVDPTRGTVVTVRG